MKKLLIILFALIPIFSFGAQFSCSGSCTSGCLTWTIQYEVDCQGRILTFKSSHFFEGGGVSYNDHTTAPEWVGLDPTQLDPSCETDFCP